MQVGAYTISNGIFEYAVDQFYTQGDVLFLRNPDNTVDFYVCIKNAPPSTDIKNGDYFVPMWYYNVINSYSEIFDYPDAQDRVINKRTLHSVLQEKFGTAVLVSDSSSFEGILDLNNVKKVGRYIVLVKNIYDVLNFPPFIFSLGSSSSNVNAVYGLDVYESNDSIFQVVFSNVGGLVTVSVRSFINNTWSDWQTLRSSVQVQIIQSYINNIQGLINSYMISTSRQLFGLKLRSDQYSYNNVSRVLNINISNVPHSIFKSIEGILVNCNIQTGNVPNVFNILYSHMFPV
ncbi:MAG: hypothetical protein QXF12_04355, partial [Candidatus Aenigmatarchaeota archaeon]